MASAEGPRSVESPESLTGGGEPDADVTGGQAFDRVCDGMQEPGSILVTHETKCNHGRSKPEPIAEV